MDFPFVDWAAAAFARYEIAIALSLVDFATLRFRTPLKENLKEPAGD